MVKSVASPKVPGAPVEPEGETEQSLAVAAGDTSGETVAVPKAQLEALLSRVEALETSGARVKVANPEVDLPDQDSLDPGKLKSPVLSKQGWVLPTNYGANPAAKNL